MTSPTTPPTPSQPPGYPGPLGPFTPVSPEPFSAPPVPPARSVSGGARSLTIALAAAVLIAGCGISFALGRVTAPAAAGAAAGQDLRQGGLGNGGAPAGGAGNGPLASGGPQASFDLNGNGSGQGVPGDGGQGGFGDRGGFGAPAIQGTVQATDGKTLTLQLSNGQAITFKLDTSTTYSQQTAGSASDVAAGKTVIVRVNGRFELDGQQGGSTASSVTVVP